MKNQNLIYKGNLFQINNETGALEVAPLLANGTASEDWCYVDLNLLSDEDVEVLSQFKKE